MFEGNEGYGFRRWNGQDVGPAAAGAKESKHKLLDQLREDLGARHCSWRTEEPYRHWVRRFIFFHRIRHPAEMGEAEINAFVQIPEALVR